MDAPRLWKGAAGLLSSGVLDQGGEVVIASPQGPEPGWRVSVDGVLRARFVLDPDRDLPDPLEAIEAARRMRDAPGH